MLDKIDAIEEKETPAESSTEEKTSEETTPSVSEDAKETQEEDLGSPSDKYDKRFKEVYAQLKEKERELETLKSTKPETSTITDDWVPSNYKEIVDKTKEIMRAEQDADNKRAQEVEAQVTEAIEEARAIHPDIKDDDVWNYMITNEITNVYEAVTKMQASKKVSNDANKKVADKVGGNVNSSGSKATRSYEQLRKLSLDDI